ncbi:MAG: hypothetical protein PUG60_08735 [Lachnospiraceae bacterium]|nr:hypothetical protein [Lachnospiraceae bacterium]MDY4971663.1 hypothetical protein [Lachnospiraceae bacterium]
MEHMIKNTYDKIKMDAARKTEIRNVISNSQRRNHAWIKYAVCAAVCMAVLLSMPAARTAIAHAAEFITEIFYTADGSSVIYEEGDHEMQFAEESDHEIRFTIEAADVNYTEVIDGRLYFVYDDIRIDVTDKCDENSCYRYEAANEDGGKSVILIGGTVTDYGWVELVFDRNGTYIFNRMNIEGTSGSEAAWVNIAMHREGVPCGDPVLDAELDKLN